MISGNKIGNIRFGVHIYKEKNNITFKDDGVESVVKVLPTQEPQVLFSSSDNYTVENIRFTNLKFVGDPTRPSSALSEKAQKERELFWSSQSGSAIRVGW